MYVYEHLNQVYEGMEYLARKISTKAAVDLF